MQLSMPSTLALLLSPLVLATSAPALLPPQDSAGFEFRLRPLETRAPGRAEVLPLGWRGAMPTVEVWVNGEGPFVFAIDTGGQGSARVTPGLIERLGLPVVGEIQGGDPTGRQTVAMPVVELEHLALGEVEFEGVLAASRSYARIPGGPAIDGILGAHLFSELVLTLDYEKERMRIEKPPFYEPRGVTLLELSSEADGVPEVLAQLGELSLPILIDTGKMGGLGVPAEMLGGLTPVGESRLLGKGRTITGEIEIRSVVVEEAFILGGLRLEQPTIESTELLPVAVLGSKFMSGRVLTLDQPGRRAWIRDSAEDVRRAERESAPDSTAVEGPFEVPIDLSTGRPWLDVVVGDREPVAFLFDTGASVTVLDDDYARELGLEPIGRRGVGDPSDPKGTEVDLFLLPELSFGGAFFEGVPALAMDLDAVFAGGGPAPRAILGLPVFSDLTVQLDYAAGLLRVGIEGLPESVEGPGVVLPFLEADDPGGLPEFELDVAGHRIGAHLDSGAPMGLSLPSSLMEELSFVGQPMMVGQARTVSARFDIHRGTVDGEILLGGLVVPSSGVMFMPRLREGNLGGMFLRGHAVTIDLDGRRLLVVPNP